MRGIHLKRSSVHISIPNFESLAIDNSSRARFKPCYIIYNVFSFQIRIVVESQNLG